MTIDIRTNAGSTTVNIKIDSGLDAAGLEHLIRLLAETRAGMTPPIPREMGEMKGAAVLRQNITTMAADPPVEDGSITVHLRNSGVGWLSWCLQRRQAIDLRDFLNGYFPDGGNNAPIGREKPTH